MSRQAELQALLDRAVAERDEVHGAVLWVDSPRMQWQGAAGYADREATRPMQPLTQFRSASIGKMACAAALLSLVDEGRVDLDASAARYLPLAQASRLHVLGGRDYSGQVTLRQMLNHTSGLPDFLEAYPGQEAFIAQMMADPDALWDPADVLAWSKAHQTPLFPPGARWHYSDTGFLVAGLVIEAVTGQPLHAVYRQRLFEPIGMAHTYLVFREPERRSLPDQGESHAYVGDLNYSLPRTVSADWAGGGLVTTAPDLIRFIRAIAEGRLFRTPSTLAAMQTWTPTGEPGVYYGLGLRRLIPAEMGEALYHPLPEVWGHTGALKSFVFYAPSIDAVISGTLNQAETPGVWSAVRPVAHLIPEALRLLA